MIPTMTPNNPRADPKISITRILTKVSGVYASDRAHPDPVIPTAMLCFFCYIINDKILKKKLYPQTRLLIPTETPVQNIE